MEKKIKSEDIIEDIIEDVVNEEERLWTHLENARKSMVVCSGLVSGLEIHKPTKTYCCTVFYKGKKVYIPLNKMAIPIGNKRKMDRSIEAQRISLANSLLGAEIDFVIETVDRDKQQIWASREKAKIIRIKRCYEKTLDDGKPLLRVGRENVKSRIIGLAAKSIYVDIAGVEVKLGVDKLTLGWVEDLRNIYKIGSTVRLTIDSIKFPPLKERKTYGNFYSLIEVEAHLSKLDKMEMKDIFDSIDIDLQQSNYYVGTVTAAHSGKFFIGLENGAKAISDKFYGSELPMAGDTIVFRATGKNDKRMVVLGEIVRVIDSKYR